MLPICSQFLPFLLKLQISHTRRHFFKKNSAVRAHIRIFLAFRICINFCPISKFEPAGPDLLWTFWKCSQSMKLGLFPLFWWSKFDRFYIWPFFDQKQLSWPVLPLREHERPLTRLPKATFTFGLGPTVWLHEAIEYSAHKLIRQRKYITIFFRQNFKISLSFSNKICVKLRKWCNRAQKWFN